MEELTLPALKKSIQMDEVDDVLEIGELEDDQDGFTHSIYFPERFHEILKPDWVEQFSNALSSLDGIDEVIFINGTCFAVTTKADMEHLKSEVVRALKAIID